MMRGFVIVLAALLAGCGGHANVQANSSNVSAGGSVNIPGRSTMGTLLSIVFLGGVSYESERGTPRSAHVPDLDPSRRVVEQDCTKSIEDTSANLKCR
jgi:hypothetical protein